MDTVHCNGCGQAVPAKPSTLQDRPILIPLRHKAPCGATCRSGCANGDGFSHDEKTHDPPWDGPPETDGHYHGECPMGCFKECCKPAGNLCGPRCQRCFGCRSCGYVHAAETPHMGYGW